jgi:pentatricopeptide repeat protein
VLAQLLRKVVPDRISFNSVISACNVQSAWHAGLNLLVEMKAAFIRPNETWQVLGLTWFGHVEKMSE